MFWQCKHYLAVLVAVSESNIVKTWGYFQKMFPGNLPAVNSSTSSISKSQTLVRGEHINQIII